MNISFSQQIIDKVKDFALITDTKNGIAYEGRGQNYADIRIIQKIYGTIAELWVNKFLNAGHEDKILEVLEHGGYFPDVIKGDLKISVKSQNLQSANKNGISFMFQKNDKITIGRSNCTHLVAIVIDDKIKYGTSLEQYIQSINTWRITKLVVLPSSEIQKYLGEPKKEILRGTKTVLYLDKVPKELLEKYKSDFNSLFNPNYSEI